jgi:glycosyltransferase involved in cell wall biosynthesis
VHDDARYVEDSLRSILRQTYRNFELLAINDGSTDESGAILDQLAREDRRVRVVHQENVGLTQSLNRGLELARGELVARQDSDDLSRPERLARQIRFLETHAEHWVVGSRYAKIGPDGERLGRGRPPLGDARIRLHLMMKGNALAHSSVLFRRAPIVELGGYDPRFKVSQDYELWCRVALEARLENLPVVLLDRREHPGQVGKTRSEEQKTAREAIRQRYREALKNADRDSGSLPLARFLARAPLPWRR